MTQPQPLLDAPTLSAAALDLLASSDIKRYRRKAEELSASLADVPVTRLNDRVSELVSLAAAEDEHERSAHEVELSLCLCALSRHFEERRGARGSVFAVATIPRASLSWSAALARDLLGMETASAQPSGASSEEPPSFSEYIAELRTRGDKSKELASDAVVVHRELLAARAIARDVLGDDCSADQVVAVHERLSRRRLGRTISDSLESLRSSISAIGVAPSMLQSTGKKAN